jgi:predicted nicotinamide N-methyase
MIADIPAFIRENTRVSTPSHVPEIRLHLADDAVALWEMTEEELGRIGLPPPFWAFAWAGGQALARHLIDQPQIARGKRVLDVASGSGLVAITAMRAGAAHATGVDIDPFCAHAGALNAALNGVTIATSDIDPIGKPTDCDLILVGDLFYDRDLSPPLLAWLNTLAAEGKDILIGDPGRTYLPKDRLVRIAEYAIPTPRALEDSEVKRTGVWRLR